MPCVAVYPMPGFPRNAIRQVSRPPAAPADPRCHLACACCSHCVLYAISSCAPHHAIQYGVLGLHFRADAMCCLVWHGRGWVRMTSGVQPMTNKQAVTLSETKSRAELFCEQYYVPCLQTALVTISPATARCWRGDACTAAVCCCLLCSPASKALSARTTHRCYGRSPAPLILHQTRPCPLCRNAWAEAAMSAPDGGERRVFVRSACMRSCCQQAFHIHPSIQTSTWLAGAPTWGRSCTLLRNGVAALRAADTGGVALCVFCRL